MIKQVYYGYYNMFARVMDGKTYEWVSRKDIPLIEGNKECDCVVIVALDANGNMAVVKQLRPCLNEYIYELPAGKIEPGETAIEAAKRELKEETGLEITFIRSVRSQLFSCCGITDEMQTVVYCDCEGELSTEYLDEGEIITPMFVNKDNVDQILNKAVHMDTKLYTLLLALYE